ncbi:MAG: class I SAM-dependent methyltransferase, partial [Ignavibacteria bacterium]|nr:class I SAM-dependent methyltransferase [Ignavibacteria bacterium]
LAVLAAIVRCVRPRTVFEFGTQDGNTTLQLALNVPEECVVYTIDLPSQNKVTRLRLDSGDREMIETVSPGERFKEAPSAKKIVQIQSDSATYDYSSLKGKIDIVFVDASHSYEYIKNDTKHALVMLAPEGIILWHDYMVWNDVTDYLNELSKTVPLLHINNTSLVVYNVAQRTKKLV